MDRLSATDPLREEALRFLFGRIDYERTSVVPYDEQRFKLDRMRELLARLGNPAQDIPTVHIAGTKGKGSTAAMVASVLTEAGFRTGVYSSPHLHRLEERASIDGQPCTAAELVDLLQTIRPAVLEMDQASELTGLGRGPTFFEITTAMALLHFERQAADFAVLEVGLGGRLDSTNVCQPVVSVITSISFDHTKLLGNTLAAIAGEKAGIIKPGVPVVSGAHQPEAAVVIRDVAKSQGCALFAHNEQFAFDYLGALDEESEAADDARRLAFINYRELRGEQVERSIDRVGVALAGKHQGANAAVAIATLHCLRDAGFAIPEQVIRRGLSQVRCPARVEVFGDRPAYVVDAAHNVASIEALVGTVEELFPGQPRLLLFATSNDKDIKGMLRRLLPDFEQIVFARYAVNPRAADPRELLRLAEQISATSGVECPLDARVVEDPRDGWQQLCDLAGPDHVVCAAGSTFLASEILPLARNRQPIQVSS